jgi:hypothetical protein
MLFKQSRCIGELPLLLKEFSLATVKEKGLQDEQGELENYF